MQSVHEYVEKDSHLHSHQTREARKCWLFVKCKLPSWKTLYFKTHVQSDRPGNVSVRLEGKNINLPEALFQLKA